MSRHSKPGSGKPHPNPDNNGGGEQKRSITGSVHVQGEIEVHLPPDVKKENSTSNNKKETREGIKLWIEGLSLFFLVIYAGLTGIQSSQSIKAATAAKDAADTAKNTLIQSQKDFVRDQRPYVWQAIKTTSSPRFQVNPKDPSVGYVLWEWHMTNYGKTPGNHVLFTQEIKLGDETYVPSLGESGKDVGNPQAPGGDTFDTVISRPIKRSEFDRLLMMNEGISIRVVIWYSDADGSNYESGICLSRTNAGSITYCKEGNYIK
jgi:hypothetical protein